MLRVVGTVLTAYKTITSLHVHINAPTMYIKKCYQATCKNACISGELCTRKMGLTDYSWWRMLGLVSGKSGNTDVGELNLRFAPPVVSHLDYGSCAYFHI